MSGHPLITTGRENGRRRPRGYTTWKPHRKQQAIVAAVVEILEEYEDHLPLTVRQIFYRLVASYGYEKTEPAYKRLADYLVSARRAQMVPFWCIRDDGVLVSRDDWHDGPEDFWDDTGRRIKQYRRNRQAGPAAVHRALVRGGGDGPAAQRRGEGIFRAGLQHGRILELDGDQADRREGDQARDRHRAPPRRRLRPIGRVGLLGDGRGRHRVRGSRPGSSSRSASSPCGSPSPRTKVYDYDLPTSPAKKSDSRSASWVGETCQLEALAPDDLASIVRDEIEGVMDGQKLAQQIEREEDDRLELGRALPRGGAT